ncbi:DUF4352 domain-containing protein [Jatrophihabitans fulvus]
MRISLPAIRSTKVSANGPGEIAGAALAVTIGVQNRSGRSLDLGSASVELVDSEGQVGTPTTEAPAKALPETVVAGATARGVYVFVVPASRRSRVDIFVSYSAGAPVAHFRGAAA